MGGGCCEKMRSFRLFDGGGAKCTNTPSAAMELGMNTSLTALWGGGGGVPEKRVEDGVSQLMPRGVIFVCVARFC